MPDAMMYYEDNYVVLPPTMKEQFVSLPELEQILRDLLTDMYDLPPDLRKLPSMDDRVHRLIETTCELDSGDRGIWQWYVVRLDKPSKN